MGENEIGSELNRPAAILSPALRLPVVRIRARKILGKTANSGEYGAHIYGNSIRPGVTTGKLTNGGLSFALYPKFCALSDNALANPRSYSGPLEQ